MHYMDIIPITNKSKWQKCRRRLFFAGEMQRCQIKKSCFDSKTATLNASGYIKTTSKDVWSNDLINN